MELFPNIWQYLQFVGSGGSIAYITTSSYRCFSFEITCLLFISQVFTNKRVRFYFSKAHKKNKHKRPKNDEIYLLLF